jgi:hypothetical protein
MKLELYKPIWSSPGLDKMFGAQARLTLQQVVAWGLETCPHDDGDGTLCYRHACGQCWAELKEQVK